MALHDDLLAFAGGLLGPGRPEAEYRRAVSTAYYAAFHLLIDAATARGVPTADLRPHVARNFEHRAMATVCRRYLKAVTDLAGGTVPAELRQIGTAFVQLQSDRHLADYSVAVVITLAEATGAVQLARAVFTAWAAVAGTPAADTFLTELLVGGVRER